MSCPSGRRYIIPMREDQSHCVSFPVFLGQTWKRLYVRFAARYWSPKQKQLTPDEQRVRQVTLDLKVCRADAIAEAVVAMRDLLNGSELLVPVPDHRGHTRANLLLTQALAAQTGCEYQDVLIKTRETESQWIRHHRGRGSLRSEELYITCRGCLRDGRILFVDNHVASGETLRAVCLAVGRGDGLVYSRGDVVIYQPDEKG